MKNRLIILIILLLIIGCNEENSKKVYKQFDTVDISEIKSSDNENDLSDKFVASLRKNSKTLLHSESKVEKKKK